LSEGGLKAGGARFGGPYLLSRQREAGRGGKGVQTRPAVTSSSRPVRFAPVTRHAERRTLWRTGGRLTQSAHMWLAATAEVGPRGETLHGRCGTLARISAAMIAVIVNVALNFVDRAAQRNATVLARRRDALFAALRVVDHVYANEPLDGVPSHPHSWNLQLARGAWKSILVYCDKPDQTLEAFKRAIGLHNPSVERPPGVDLMYLDKFRLKVARELELSTSYQGDPHHTWIGSLAGGVCGDG
jgi:hypothetical protein